MELGDAIRSYRNMMNMTQKELADKLSISPSTIGMYEQNRRIPDIETLSKISNIFQVSLDYLLGTEKSGGNDYSNFQIFDECFDFKERIRRLMKEQEMSEDAFMQLTGFDKAVKDSYLYGNRVPSIEDLIKIAGVLNVSTDFLLDVSKRKRLSAEEEMLLQLFAKCNQECKDYLLAKAGVLSVEGLSAVAATEPQKYRDDKGKLSPSSGTGGGTMVG